MKISPPANTANNVELPIEQLARNPELSDAEKIGQLSRQFEAVLLRQILQQAHKTIIKSSLAEDSATTGIYQDMITNQLAECISKSGSFGFARNLQEELTRQLCHQSVKEPIED
jgi:Rod binding domain-containing protein